MADGRVSREAADHRLRAEIVADKAERLVAVEMFAIEADDAHGLLSPMLQRVQPECRRRGRVRMLVDAKNAALIMEVIVINVAVITAGRDRLRTRYALVRHVQF
jgi:hypothetical protein